MVRVSSIRRRLWFARAAALLGAIVVASASVLYDARFMLAILVVGAVCGLYMMNIKCARCGTPVLLTYVHVLREVRVPLVVPFAGKKCSVCGRRYSDDGI